MLMFFRGRVFQESGFTGVWFISRLVFSDDRYFRGLVLQVCGLQGSGLSGVRFFRGQYVKRSGFSGSHISGVSFSGVRFSGVRYD